jgi:hypothetical protein
MMESVRERKLVKGNKTEREKYFLPFQRHLTTAQSILNMDVTFDLQ